MLEKAQAQSFNAQSFNAYDRPHDDLREFIARAEDAGEIVRIAGAHWKLEMGSRLAPSVSAGGLRIFPVLEVPRTLGAPWPDRRT